MHQLMLMVRAKRDVLIPGTPPNRKAVAVLVAVVLVLAVVRTQNIAQSWPVFVVIAVACVTVFAGGCGLAANGMYSRRPITRWTSGTDKPFSGCPV